ncbi:TetR/AcrR family transcriptional regulator [Pelagovum pacificum]|uniref:TetR/AcrR family transcriptional regulator n=1 Tax=Pelagovum pacificum TaxID=2588711 RepID=A0A5C5GD39_9RHOB|nr:TetR/AcrR family transcriptional regulator [Pelagovum pacificum]QQA44465.1 TetR/AcrR family transcriptional regulator [Pelagovum pacificum]TNY32420.1 TetR/AcrR family transcriptional regulator [Pelagovum pacificum]
MSKFTSDERPRIVPPERKTTRRRNRRTEILEKAGTLFARMGVDAVTTRHIAQDVGISQPSLYAHFTSLQQIKDEVAAQAFALLEEKISAAEDESPEAQLEKAVRGYFEFGFSNPHAYRIAFMLEHPGDERGSEDASMSTFNQTDHPGPRAFGHLVRIVGLNRPDLSTEMILLRSQNLWASLHGLVSLLLARPDFPWSDTQMLVDEHCRLTCRMVFA